MAGSYNPFIGPAPSSSMHLQNELPAIVRTYKINLCPLRYPHDWNACDDYHVGEYWRRRRDPEVVPYKHYLCHKFHHNFQTTGWCSRGEACLLAHGMTEQCFHPDVYQTTLCQNLDQCPYRRCSYAHSLQELRPIKRQGPPNEDFSFFNWRLPSHRADHPEGGPVMESRNNSAPARGGRGGAGRGGGRGGRGYGDCDHPYQDYTNTDGYARGPDAAAGENGAVAAGTEEGQGGKRGPRGPRGPYPGGPRRGAYGNGEEGEEGRPRRSYDRHSSTGCGFGMKKDGAGRANWGTSTDENPADKEIEENVNAEERPEKAAGQEDVLPSEEAAKEREGDEAEKEKEEEDKMCIPFHFNKHENLEMTLEDYEKVLEEKRKAILALRAEERKVEVDKELQSMQVLSTKKNNDEVFIKLGADKGSKKKESAEEKAKKSLSINEFLKPAEGESFYGRSHGRGGRGRGGDRGSFKGDGRNRGPAATPSLADQSQFPSLGGK